MDTISAAATGDAVDTRGRKRPDPGSVGFAALVALLLVMLVVVFVARSGQAEDNAAIGENDAVELDQAIEQILAEATPAPDNAAVVYAALVPSFVVVQVDRDETIDDRSDGLGSGVIINAAGDIVTSRHVVVNAETITVTFSDGTKATAVVDAVDPDRDTAFLVADAQPTVLVPAVLGNLSAMNRGDAVYAIGNPLGLAGSISSGVISGFDRSLPIDDEVDLEGLIQFDAAVNPGSSGGPLVNASGQVIGIVTALANPGDDASFSGIGFAVPIGLALGGTAGGGPSQ